MAKSLERTIIDLYRDKQDKQIDEQAQLFEGMMKNMAIDLKDMPHDEFQRKYNMSKADAMKKFGAPEVKSAPKGYHFTKDGKLKKGDADVDGDGGEKLRSDPLDKQRNKIPPLPEEVEIEEAKDPSMDQVFRVMGPTKNAQEGVKEIMRVFKVDEKKAMKLLDAAIKDVLGEKFANPAQQAAAMAAIKKSGKYKKPKDESIEEETLDELSIMTLNRYYKKALQAIHKSRKSHDASIMRGMDPSKDKATISKRAKGVNLAKSRALKKVRGEEVEIQEDGHKDIASAKNKVKIAMSALQKMQGELNKLGDDADLPSWWMGKVAVAVDKIDGMADYLDTQVEEAAPKPLNRSDHTHTVHIDGEGKYRVKAKSMDHAKKVAFKQAGISKLHGHPTMEPKTRIYGEEVEVVTEREDTASAVAKAMKKMGVKYDRKKEDSIISKIPKVLDSMKLSSGAKRMLLRDRDFIADVLDDLGEEDATLVKVAKKLKGASKKHAKQADVIMKHVDDMEEKVQTKPATNESLFYNYIQKLVKGEV